DVHNYLPFLAAERRRRGQARNGEQADANKVQAIVIKLLLGNGIAGNRELRDRNIGSVELNDVGWRHARGRDAQDGVRYRGNLRDGRANVGVRLKVNPKHAYAGN